MHDPPECIFTRVTRFSPCCWSSFFNCTLRAGLSVRNAFHTLPDALKTSSPIQLPQIFLCIRSIFFDRRDAVKMSDQPKCEDAAALQKVYAPFVLCFWMCTGCGQFKKDVQPQRNRISTLEFGQQKGITKVKIFFIKCNCMFIIPVAARKFS